jgi:3(or 17)beta-hydroxysteroid dehydrogenase
MATTSKLSDTTPAGRVNGKVIAVTGAASGIGRATAHLLALEGASVVLVDITDEDGEKEADAIRSAGGDAIYVSGDVTSPTAWQRVVEQVRNRYGRLDVLVNNAGGGQPADLESETPDNWRKVVGLSLDAAFYGTRAFLPLLKENPAGGLIINTSSYAGSQGTSMFVSYSCAKAGLQMLSRLISVHAIERGYPVRCNTVSPGITATPKVLANTEGHFDPDVHKTSTAVKVGLMGPRAVGQCEDVANAVLFLASDEARQVNGAIVAVDGGAGAL